MSKQPTETQLPLHGGDIIAAAKRYGIPVDQWVDLSTGISPESYPVSNIPSQCFQQLPYLTDEFIAAVQAYYGVDSFVPVAGTQVAIQALPALLDSEARYPVLVPSIGYQEHALHWQHHGSDINYYASDSSTAMLVSIQRQLEANPQQHLVIIHPNNPTTVQLEVQQLASWANQLAAGAYLIVDEAFIDTEPCESLLTQIELPGNVLVLRSFGKFFGLAGLRLGFVFGSDDVVARLTERVGLWQVNGPAQYVATQALQDTQWQAQARQRIMTNSQLMQQLLAPLMRDIRFSSQGLFTVYSLSLAAALQVNDALASQGVLTRVVTLKNEKALLRVGSVSSSAQQTITHITQAVDCIVRHKY